MEKDMHYGAIHYLAYLAGIEKMEAKKIAWSSQLVDDAKFGGTVQLDDNNGYICANSAHRHLIDNLSVHTRLVWIPFHFVPDPKREGPFLERLECVKDNELAGRAVVEAINEADIEVRPYRFGVALHAYADTWSHWGFSGLPSDTNLVSKVKPLNVGQSLFEKVLSWFGSLFSREKNIIPIGHSYAATCPDLPYLKWQYVNQGASSPVPPRENYEDFEKALVNIYAYMNQYKGSPSSAAIPSSHHDTIVKLIRLRDDNEDRRLAQWERIGKNSFV